MKPKIMKSTDNNKQISIKDMKNGPPSIKRSTNGLDINNCFEKKEIIIDGF